MCKRPSGQARHQCLQNIPAGQGDSGTALQHAPLNYMYVYNANWSCCRARTYLQNGCRPEYVAYALAIQLLEQQEMIIFARISVYCLSIAKLLDTSIEKQMLVPPCWQRLYLLYELYEVYTPELDTRYIRYIHLNYLCIWQQICRKPLPCTANACSPRMQGSEGTMPCSKQDSTNFVVR